MSVARGCTILLTGFESFAGRARNASWDVVQRVAAGWTGPQLVTRRLPVAFQGARSALRTAVDEVDPDLVLCVGEAGGRGAVGLERVAVNLVDAPIPDAEGSMPTEVPVVAGAPTAYLSSLPLRSCLAAGAATGHPVEISGTAGTYVCNATFYALMHLLEDRRGTRGGFVHVPRAPGQALVGAPSLAVDSSASVVGAVLRRALDLSPEPAPVVVSGALD